MKTKNRRTNRLIAELVFKNNVSAIVYSYIYFI